MFVLIIGGTEVCRIPGISMAGAHPAMVPFTAPADADLLWWGAPRVVDAIPMDPQGHPTPGLITRAAQLEAHFSVLVIRAGSFVPPACPYIETATAPGGRPDEYPAVPEATRLFEWGKTLGTMLARAEDPLVIGESVPGGTTTAFLLLRALGYEGMVSSAGPENPISLKEALWQRTTQRLGNALRTLPENPLQAVAELGDPMQPLAAGLAAGAAGTCRVILAGGTQMLAVAALARRMGQETPLTVATTTYVARDPSAHFLTLAERIGVEPWAAPLDFSRSAHAGLRDYEKGFVKEGVGAGGAVWYAAFRGIATDRVIARTEELYAEMLKSLREIPSAQALDR